MSADALKSRHSRPLNRPSAREAAKLLKTTAEREIPVSTEVKLSKGTEVVHCFPVAYCVAAGKAWAVFAVPPTANRITGEREEGFLSVHKPGFKPGDWAAVYYVVRPDGVQERISGPPPVFKT